MGEPKKNMQTLISQFRKQASSNRDLHPGLRGGYVPANPPFNVSDLFFSHRPSYSLN
jgi:hypothetical protein